MDAFYWFKKYNPEYKDIVIAEKNLDWMGEGVLEKDLPVTTTVIEIEEDELHKSNSDTGPAPSHIENMEENKEEYQETYGIIPTSFNHIPKTKDNNTTNIIKDISMESQKVRCFQIMSIL